MRMASNDVVLAAASVLACIAALAPGAAAAGVPCDLSTCECDGVSLAHLKDKVYTGNTDLEGYTVAVKMCAAFTEAELGSYGGCGGEDAKVYADNGAAVIKYSQDGCQVLGSVGPCPFVAGRCGMSATKTVPAPDFAPAVFELTVQYEYSLSVVQDCQGIFELDMTMATSEGDATGAVIGPITVEGEATCEERKTHLRALLPPAAVGGDDDDGNCTMPADRGSNPPTEEECAVLWDSCDTDGLINYLSIYYCELGYARYHLETWRGVAMGFILLWLFVLFMMLGSTADDFFSPSLIVLSNKMNLSERTAGVTLLALGNGAPDLFSVINTIYKKKPQVGLALGDLTGGGNFVVTIVLSALLVVVGTAGLKVEGMFFRDAVFYSVSVIFVYVMMLSGEISLTTSLMFFFAYVGYCFGVIVVGPRTPPCLPTRREEWKLSRGNSGAASDLSAALITNDGADGSVGLSAADGAALVSSVLGESASRLSSANIADIAATTTALLEEAAAVQGMWMQLTGWEEKSMAEKVIYMMETPFTILRL